MLPLGRPGVRFWGAVSVGWGLDPAPEGRGVAGSVLDIGCNEFSSILKATTPADTLHRKEHISISENHQ